MLPTPQTMPESAHNLGIMLDALTWIFHRSYPALRWFLWSRTEVDADEV
jgi:hypothetical protein